MKEEIWSDDGKRQLGTSDAARALSDGEYLYCQNFLAAILSTGKKQALTRGGSVAAVDAPPVGSSGNSAGSGESEPIVKGSLLAETPSLFGDLVRPAVKARKKR